MQFTFPDNKSIYYNSLQNFSVHEGRPFFEPIDILKPKGNLIEIERQNYYFTYMNAGKPGQKGGNSILLKLFNSELIDEDDIEYGDPDLVLKISKFRKSFDRIPPSKGELRFQKEINALLECNKRNFQNIIKVYNTGVCRIMNANTGRFEPYLFYTMEYAKSDLKVFVEENHSVLNLDEKLTLCISLCEGLKELISIGYFHRDIKPDNIFITSDNIWKIGDLGLLAERNDENQIDKVAEQIGPKGWMSPESMNKYLCEGKGFNYPHNFNIDHQSDIFQLGKVFWYIFQYNVPIGSIRERDFLLKDTRIYEVLRTMLNHSKRSRYKEIDEVILLLKSIQRRRFNQKVA